MNASRTVTNRYKVNLFGLFKAGFHMSHFIAVHSVSLQLVGCPQLRLSNYMKIEDRNSSEFLLFHRRKLNILIRWDRLRRTAMNCDELGYLLLVGFHVSEIILIDRGPRIPMKYDEFR